MNSSFHKFHSNEIENRGFFIGLHTENISEKEKLAVALPLGTVVAVLESVGLRNVVKQKGLMNKVLLKALGKYKGLRQVQGRGFQDVVRQEVDNMISRGVLTIAAGGVAEFETGAAQEIADISAKAIYNNIKDANIAATLLKVQERKTAKGNSYAVLKLTDLTSVFELFIFSDILELNRETLIEGNSLILTLVKSISSDENRFKRINVQKIASLKDLFNSPINEVSFDVKTDEEVNEISKLLNEDGKTIVNISLTENDKKLEFRLKNPKNLDRKSLNLLRKRDISITIN